MVTFKVRRPTGESLLMACWWTHYYSTECQVLKMTCIREGHMESISLEFQRLASTTFCWWIEFRLLPPGFNHWNSEPTFEQRWVVSNKYIGRDCTWLDGWKSHQEEVRNTSLTPYQQKSSVSVLRAAYYCISDVLQPLMMWMTKCISMIGVAVSKQWLANRLTNWKTGECQDWRFDPVQLQTLIDLISYTTSSCLGIHHWFEWCISRFQISQATWEEHSNRTSPNQHGVLFHVKCGRSTSLHLCWKRQSGK